MEDYVYFKLSSQLPPKPKKLTKLGRNKHQQNKSSAIVRLFCVLISKPKQIFLVYANFWSNVNQNKFKIQDNCHSSDGQNSDYRTVNSANTGCITNGLHQGAAKTEHKYISDLQQKIQGHLAKTLFDRDINVKFNCGQKKCYLELTGKSAYLT